MPMQMVQEKSAAKIAGTQMYIFGTSVKRWPHCWQAKSRVLIPELPNAVVCCQSRTQIAAACLQLAHWRTSMVAVGIIGAGGYAGLAGELPLWRGRKRGTAPYRTFVRGGARAPPAL